VINKNSYILFGLGVLGLILFVVLQPVVNFNSGGPIMKSAAEIEQQVAEISDRLGFSSDSLAVTAVFQQHVQYAKQLKDSFQVDLSVNELNNRNIHTQSWQAVVGSKGKAETFIVSPSDVFESVGRLSMRVSNQGQVIRLRANQMFENPTFVQGDSLEMVANTIISDVFGYEQADYELDQDEWPDTLVMGEGKTVGASLSENSPELLNTIELKWRNKNKTSTAPKFLTLNLEPEVKELNEDGVFSTRFGYQVLSFQALHENEPANLNQPLDQDFQLFTYFLFICAIGLAILVFAVGVRNIFKGKVEWRRALVMLIAIGACLLLWRLIFYNNVYGDFFDGQGFFILSINSTLTGVMFGLYGAMAYISWEAFARVQKNGELELVDAFWQRRFFVSEAGASLLHGFFLGGILLGLTAISLFALDSYFLQTDSQFGFTEASNPWKILTVNMTLWSTVWLITLGQIGFIYGFCRHWIKKKRLSYAVIFIVITILLTTLGRLFSTPLSFLEDVVLFVPIGLVATYCYQRYGIVTISTAFWVFYSVIMITPYIGSESIEMASMWWVQAFLIAGIPIAGFVTYKYGIPVSDVGDYIPEYEERMAQHLRVEKEIEIARESQYKLMPLKPPVANGIDVYGFFLPSFEVGGDYFDYVLTKNESGDPTDLTMTVVDVSGKAMRAAMPAIFTSGLLLSRMKTEMPEVILSEVSEPIHTRTDKRTFITCAMARYNLETRALKVANAGHCKPVIKRNGHAEFITTPEPRYPLGVKADTIYKSEEIQLKKGDVFFLYSDGLPEAVNDKGERFGFDEVPRLLERIPTENLSANEIAQEIKRAVQKFSNYQLADDTTVICLKV
jgi:serine phosphatase RsbU (regulator of sigma subunit)